MTPEAQLAAFLRLWMGAEHACFAAAIAADIFAGKLQFIGGRIEIPVDEKQPEGLKS